MTLVNQCRVMASALIILLLSAVSPDAADISGKPRIIDGDTLQMAGYQIRLFGIDAPEARQTCTADGKEWPCGEKASIVLAEETAEREVRCVVMLRSIGVAVAVCYVGANDLNALMVRKGWALARHDDAYVDEEAAAREARRGIWRGEFMPPWEWRKRNPQ